MKSWWNPPFDIQEPRISNALDPFRAIFIPYLLRNDIESRKRLDTVLRWYGYEWRRFLLFRICWEKSSSVCPSASLGTMPFPKERIQSWNRERGTTDVKKRGRIPPSLFSYGTFRRLNLVLIQIGMTAGYFFGKKPHSCLTGCGDFSPHIFCPDIEVE